MRAQKDVDPDDHFSNEETETLSVAEMIGHLRALENNMMDDPCLTDLVAEVVILRIELEERRELAIQVAAEIDAKNCLKPN